MHIADTAMKLQNDIIGDIIDILAAEGNLDHLKPLSTVSSFCLHRCRQHIFSAIASGGFWIKRPSISRFLSFFSQNPAPLPYVRHLVLEFYYPSSPFPRQVSSCDDPLSTFAQFPDVVLQMENLESISLGFDLHPDYYSNVPVVLDGYGVSWQNPIFRPLRSTLTQLLESRPSLTDLSLKNITNFSVTDLANACFLQRLHLDEVTFLGSEHESDDEAEADPGSQISPNPHLQSLTIDNRRTKPSHIRDMATALLERYPDGRFILPLSLLKRLQINCKDEAVQCDAFRKLVKSQCRALEALITVIENPYDNHSSTMFDSLILSQARTLKALTINLSGMQQFTFSPYLSACSTIQRLASNELTSLRLIVSFPEETGFASLGDEWVALCKAFQLKHSAEGSDRDESWLSLKRVELCIIITACPKEGSKYTKSLEAMRDTYFLGMMGRSFDFNLTVVESKPI